MNDINELRSRVFAKKVTPWCAIEVITKCMHERSVFNANREKGQLRILSHINFILYIIRLHGLTRYNDDHNSAIFYGKRYSIVITRRLHQFTINHLLHCLLDISRRNPAFDTCIFQGLKKRLGRKLVTNHIVTKKGIPLFVYQLSSPLNAGEHLSR